jgi:hypothetical protein
MNIKFKAFSDELRKLAIADSISKGTSMFPVNASGQINYITPYGQSKHLSLGQSFHKNPAATLHNNTQPGAAVIVENNQMRV